MSQNKIKYRGVIIVNFDGLVNKPMGELGSVSLPISYQLGLFVELYIHVPSRPFRRCIGTSYKPVVIHSVREKERHLVN